MVHHYYTPYSPPFTGYANLPSFSNHTAMAPSKRPSSQLLSEILAFPTNRFTSSTNDAAEGALDTAVSRIKMFFHIAVR